MPPFELDGEPASLLYLINLTAGLLDGDGHLIEITARAGTRAVVTGQSATRIHPALASFATQQWAVDGRGRRLPGRPAGPGDPVPRQPLLSARTRRACPARPVDLGRHLAARPLRPRRAFGAVPVRADRPGLRGPSRRPAGLSRPLPLGWPLDPRGRRLVSSAGPWPPPACSSPGRCPRLCPRPARRSGARSSGSTPAKAASGGAATRRPSRPTSCKRLSRLAAHGPAGQTHLRGSSPRAASPPTTGSRPRRDSGVSANSTRAGVRT